MSIDENKVQDYLDIMKSWNNDEFLDVRLSKFEDEAQKGEYYEEFMKAKGLFHSFARKRDRKQII